ncbi:MAG: PAS domain-containing protein [Acidobacteriales bacterium]|nr:PAS domain-containing protein [Terriglobales bacterium]
MGDGGRIFAITYAEGSRTGYSRNELIGRIGYEILSPPSNWPRMRRGIRDRLSGKEENYEHELISKGGKVRWVSVRATPYRNAHGQIVGTVGAVSCLDRQKELETQNAYLWSELQTEGKFGNIVGRSATQRRAGKSPGTDSDGGADTGQRLHLWGVRHRQGASGTRHS